MFVCLFVCLFVCQTKLIDLLLFFTRDATGEERPESALSGGSGVREARSPLCLFVFMCLYLCRVVREVVKEVVRLQPAFQPGASPPGLFEVCLFVSNLLNAQV